MTPGRDGDRDGGDGNGDGEVRTLPLKSEGELVASAVVANNAMNRERGLSGVNSYQRELGFDPYAYLLETLTRKGSAAWLDLCCGEGRAVTEAASRLTAADRSGWAVVGVDLVGRLRGPVPVPAGLSLVTASVTDFRPQRTFDLITCVHGLHYVGDKLGLLTRAARWLTDDGLFVADFDPSSVRHADGSPADRRVTRVLRQAGARYDPRRHRLSWHGPITLDFGRPCLVAPRLAASRLVAPGLVVDYLGADDAAGPSYTGQPAVASHYRWVQAIAGS